MSVWHLLKEKEYPECQRSGFLLHKAKKILPIALIFLRGVQVESRDDAMSGGLSHFLVQHKHSLTCSANRGSITHFHRNVSHMQECWDMDYGECSPTHSYMAGGAFPPPCLPFGLDHTHYFFATGSGQHNGGHLPKLRYFTSTSCVMTWPFNTAAEVSCEFMCFVLSRSVMAPRHAGQEWSEVPTMIIPHVSTHRVSRRFLAVAWTRVSGTVCYLFKDVLTPRRTHSRRER